MASAKVETVVCAQDVASGITLVVRFRGMRQWQWRLKIAEVLINLAARVAWLDADIEFDERKIQDAN